MPCERRAASIYSVTVWPEQLRVRAERMMAKSGLLASGVWVGACLYSGCISHTLSNTHTDTDRHTHRHTHTHHHTHHTSSIRRGQIMYLFVALVECKMNSNYTGRAGHRHCFSFLPPPSFSKRSLVLSFCLPLRVCVFFRLGRYRQEDTPADHQGCFQQGFFLHFCLCTLCVYLSLSSYICMCLRSRDRESS